MLPFPSPTTREEKSAFVNRVQNRLLELYGDAIAAIGLYGSVGRGTDGPYSDIEIVVVTRDEAALPGHEFILLPFKLEIDSYTMAEYRKKAGACDDYWAIRAGSFVGVLPLYDPLQLFGEIKKIPISLAESVVKDTMRQFMIWEPYETVAKIRNNFASGNLSYIPTGANDLVWQTAKLIGLANRQFYSTRANTLEESLKMDSAPDGYAELAEAVMSGDLRDKINVYRLCERLWSGLNEWFAEMGIAYHSDKLPF